MTTQYANLQSIAGQAATPTTLQMQLFLLTAGVPATSAAYTSDAVNAHAGVPVLYVGTFGEAAVISGDYLAVLSRVSGGAVLATGDRTFDGVDGETAGASVLDSAASGDTSSFSGTAATQIAAILSTAANSAVNSGLQIATEGFPASLRIGDARTADNGRSLTLRVYDIDDPETPLSQIGSLALEDAKLTLGFTRPGETEPDVEIDCTFDSAGADYWIVIAWEKAALDDLDPNLKTQYLWGVKAEWGTVDSYSDPVTVADGKVWIRQAIVPNH